MRNITPEERAIIADPDGHWFFATLDVEDADLTWRNVGALAIGTDTALEDFFNSATWTETIDQNTPLMSAVLRRDTNNYSLSPYRSDSPANARTNGTFGPVLDLHRHWRIRGCVMPRGAIPDETSYRELQSGRLDLIDIQDDKENQEGTITVSGRGMEQDVIDSYVMTAGREYGNTTSTAPAEDVIQAMLDDQLGTDEVPLFVPTPTTFGVSRFTQEEGPLMPQVAEVASLAASVLRYRHDSADTNRFTLIIPNRSPITPDWVIGPEEWRAYTLNRIDKSGIRNYIKAKYPDATFNSVQTVISPAAEVGTVTATGGAATFSTSQAGVLVVGAIIVVNDRPYRVLTFDGTTGATLSGSATFTASEWYTSPSITRYGLRPLLIDLTKKAQVTSQASAGGLVDALRSDLEDPAVERAIDVDGLWFVQLYDYVQLNPDGRNFNEVSFGGVTSITQTYANGMLRGIIGLRGKPSGGYRRWLSLGSGAPRATLLPELTADAVFVDGTNYTTDPPSIRVTINFGDRCNTARVEIFTDEALTNLWTPAVDFDRAVSGTNTTNSWGLADDTERNQTYWVRVTPFSGPFVSGTGATGITGEPVVIAVYAGTQMTPKASFDILQGDVTTLSNGPFTTHAPAAGLPSSRTWADRPGAAIDLGTAGEIGVIVDPTDPAVAGSAASRYRVPIFDCPSGMEELWTTIGAALAEVSTKLRRRANLAGASTARIVGTITETTAPAGCEARFAYMPIGGTPVDIPIGLPLDVVGPVASDPFNVYEAMANDVVLLTKTVDGDEAGMCALASLALEVEVASTVTAPPVGGGDYTDPFDVDGPMASIWEEFNGPNVTWQEFDMQGGNAVLRMNNNGIITNRGWVRADIPADPVWAIRVPVNADPPAGGVLTGWWGVNLMLTETTAPGSGAGNFLTFGVALDSAGIGGYRIMAVNHANVVVGTPVVVSGWPATLTMRRNGTNIEFYYDIGAGPVLYGSFPIATHFTGSPTYYGFTTRNWTGDGPRAYFQIWERIE